MDALALAIALDPGKTTGIAFGHIYKEPPLLIHYSQADMDENELYEFLEENKPDYLICEDFHMRRSSRGADLTPVRLIGIVGMYANRTHECTLYMQTPASAGAGGKNGPYSNARLKELGVYKRGIEHGRDALRHLLIWYTFGAGYQFNRTTEKVPIEIIEGH